jgi:hypothetical protein
MSHITCGSETRDMKMVMRERVIQNPHANTVLMITVAALWANPELSNHHFEPQKTIGEVSASF